MIKNILLIVMTILALMFFVFGYIQKIEADKNFELAESRRIEADGLRIMAEESTKEAEKQRIAATAAEQKALKAVADCDKSKRK